MKSGLAYRTAQESDIPLILRLSKALIDQYEDFETVDRSAVMSWMERKTTNFIHEYRKVTMDGSVVAYYRLCEHDGQMELDDFFVLEPYRGRGIGSRIMERILKGISCPIRLYVFNGNEGALRFYSRFNFKVAEWVSATRCLMVRASSF